MALTAHAVFELAAQPLSHRRAAPTLQRCPALPHLALTSLDLALISTLPHLGLPHSCHCCSRCLRLDGCPSQQLLLEHHRGWIQVNTVTSAPLHPRIRLIVQRPKSFRGACDGGSRDDRGGGGRGGGERGGGASGGGCEEEIVIRENIPSGSRRDSGRCLCLRLL